MAMYKPCEFCKREYRCRRDKINISRFCSKKCWGTWCNAKNYSDRKKEISAESPLDTKNKMRKNFEKFFDMTQGCWVWKGSKKSKLPYGSYSFRGKNYIAHRLAYMFYRGEIPKDKIVLHSCDNPPCVNPLHLRLGTYQDNHLDKISRGRCSVEKLTPDKVIEIKKKLLVARKRISGICFIAKEYGVSYQTIHQIRKGKTWAWLKIDE